MSKLDEIAETPQQQAQHATAALTEVVNEGETPDLDGMKRADTLAIWESFEQRVNRLQHTAESLKVENASQTAEIALAKATRLQFKKLRVEIEHKRVDLVADLKARSGKIDKDAKKLKDICESLETKLLADEQFVERQEEARKQALRDERAKILLEYGSDGAGFQLGDMAQEAFDALVNSLRQLRDDKLKAAREAEEQRIAREQQETAERERVRAENERLKFLAEKEAASRKAEREEAAARLQAEREVARKEQERLEAVAKSEREKAAREREEAAAKNAAERRDWEAKEKANREKFEAERKRQEAARKKVEAELAEKRRLDEESLRREQEEAQRVAEIARKAAQAPDREKIIAYADFIRHLPAPMMSTEAGARVLVDISAKAMSFAKWIEERAGELS